MSKNYGNLIINIFWRILALCLVSVLGYFCIDSYLQEHYKIVPGSIEYRVTKNGKHFKNFTVENSAGKTYRLEGKVDKNGRVIYFANGENLKIQSRIAKYIKNDKLTYCRHCEAGTCEGHLKNKYNFIKDNNVFCCHSSTFYVFIRLVILALCVMSIFGLICGIIRNIKIYRECNDYDWSVIRKYEYGDYLTPFGLFFDSIVCDYDLKEYIKEFFGYDNK